MAIKKLDLGMGCLGGRPHLYARNIIECGDYASICSIVGEVEDGGKIYISMYKDYKQYLDQVKQHLLSINDSLTFANDQESGQFINPKELLKQMESDYKLMSFEKEQVLINPEMQHELYLKALKYANKSDRLPHEYNYALSSGSLYPYIQTYSTICKMI